MAIQRNVLNMDLQRCDIGKLRALLAISDWAAEVLCWFACELRHELKKAHEATNAIHLRELFRFAHDCGNGVSDFESLLPGALPCSFAPCDIKHNCGNNIISNYLLEIKEICQLSKEFLAGATERILDRVFFEDLLSLVSRMLGNISVCRKAILKSMFIAK